ncbi:dynamin family protein [Marinobacter sp. ANT_B65]|uniref:dynamin family protein n=1 Tax=Marinobacter sp. ANT_B65 TaxID=2039467 RepID=UPI000BBE0A5F|nr:dynamin family protein [Marinobacter sp. ANT_B65]PCM45930.1 hypothetical protein CPA50_08220 [Marinobacter sp. ANT_B65]
MPDSLDQLMNAHTQPTSQAGAGELASTGQRKASVGGNQYLERPERGLKLCAELIAVGSKTGKVSQLLDQIHSLIEEKFLPLSERDNNTTGIGTYIELNQLKKALHEAANFPHLARSCTLAVGGSFSAGKSRFLNSVLGCPSLLPTDTTPTTSIPTYLYQGDQSNMHALNFQGKKTPIDKEALKAICHAFYKRFNVTFSHVLQLIAIEQPGLRYPNLIFLDTPGYSKSEGMGASDNNTDATISRMHLRSADYLIWLVDQQNGTIPQPDIEFIQGLELDQPILVIISKADKKPEAQIAELIASTRKTLDKAEIDYVDVVGYSSQLNREFSSSGTVLTRFLSQVDQPKAGWSVLWQVEQIFKRYIDQYESQHLSAKLTHATINELIFDESVSEDKREQLRNYQAKTKAQLDALFKQKREAEKIASELAELISALCNTLDIRISDQPSRVELSVARKAETKDDALPAYHFDALLDGDSKHLSALADLSALPGWVSKVSALGVTIKVDVDLDIIVLKQKILEQLNQSEIDSLFFEGMPVSVHILNKNRCQVTINHAN